jgi:catechol 2,3-dioxygenase-like lactoylglutathione lyase family enzyme
MAGIKVRDIAYGRLRSPDLDVQEEFLTNFGMIKVARTPTHLYMRGTDPTAFLHVTEKGDAGFIGMAWYARDEDDVKALAKQTGAEIEHPDQPGGGIRVRLKEPNGYSVEVIAGQKAVWPVQVIRQPVNSGPEPLNRAGPLMRFRKGPSSVKRIAHAVMGTPKLRETVDWFRNTLGLICSDDLYAGDKNNIIGSFNRTDCGDEFVDHHAFFCIKHEKVGLNHFSFEVQDIDDVFLGHEHLRSFQKYEHMWGIGRHLLGSQVYDYWADPYGRVHEHWADSDRINVKNGSNLLSVEEGFTSQWGEAPPEKFIHHLSP